ncbi:hypothetical protein HQ531_03240 [bacterium]|nr:hypothetical protein [bacterium]
MRDFGLLLASASILIGLFLLYSPGSLVKIGEQTNRFYDIDGLVFKNKIVFGVLLMLAALLLVYLTR